MIGCDLVSAYRPCTGLSQRRAEGWLSVRPRRGIAAPEFGRDDRRKGPRLNGRFLTLPWAPATGRIRPKVDGEFSQSACAAA
jgi:hypothetical protein